MPPPLEGAGGGAGDEVIKFGAGEGGNIDGHWDSVPRFPLRDGFVFDERLSSQDAQLRAELRYETKALHARLEPTMIHVAHVQLDATTPATRIAVMRAGDTV